MKLSTLDFFFYLFIYLFTCFRTYLLTLLTCLSFCPRGSCRLRGAGCFPKVKYHRAWMHRGSALARKDTCCKCFESWVENGRWNKKKIKKSKSFISRSRSVAREEEEQIRPRGKKKQKNKNKNCALVLCECDCTETVRCTGVAMVASTRRPMMKRHFMRYLVNLYQIT